jgi:hypothetical protein
VLGLTTPILRERTPDIDHLIEAALLVPAHVALNCACIDQLSFSAAMGKLLGSLRGERVSGPGGS